MDNQTPTMSDGTVLDPKVLKVTRAIRQVESDGNYNAVGDNGDSHGAYQFNKDNYKTWATQYGVDPTDFSPAAQNKVAYSRIKDLKDQGRSPEEIAAIWNGAHQDDTGKYVYNAPEYGVKFRNALLGGQQTTQQQPTDTTDTATPDGQPQKSFGQKTLDLLGTITGQKGLGEDIGQGLAVPYAKQQYAEVLDSWNDISTKLKQKIDALKANGEDSSHLESVLKEHLKSVPDIQKFLPDVSRKTAEQIMGDIGQSALGFSMVAGAPELLGKGAVGLGGKVLQGAVTSAGYGAVGGALSGMQDNQDIGDVAESAAKGTLIAAATGGIVSGAIHGSVAGYQGLKGLLTGYEKTAEEILATAPQDVGKLSQREQSFYYKAQSQGLTQQATEAASKATAASDASLKETTDAINQFKQNIGTMSRDQAINLKEPAQQVVKQAGQEYLKLTGEAVEGSTALDDTISHEDLSSKIDEKFGENNPELANSLKNDLQLKETPPEIDKETGMPVIRSESTKGPEITNQEIIDKAREIMASVSKASKAGGRVYTPEEYQAMQKYNFLMETLGDNGVDMSAANKFWKEWVPTRNRIMNEIKPFETTNTSKMPITSTIQNAAGTATTAKQMASKLDAQNFISAIEERRGVEKGTLTKDLSEQVQGLEKAKLSKANIQKVTDETLNQIKLDKKEALRTMSEEQFNNASQAIKRERVKSAIKKALVVVGIGTVASGAGAHIISKVL